MCTKDGIPFSVFCTSQDLRRSIVALKYNEVLPTSANGIKNTVLYVAREIENDQIKEVYKLKSECVKFSAEFDEWSFRRNRRYMNIYMFSSGKKVWNLGLVPIRNSLTEEAVLETVTTKLSQYSLSLSKDIVSVVTDGPTVMQKFGRLCPSHHQLCLAHGIQFGVVDVLYRGRRDKTPTEERVEREPESSDEDSMVIN
jgi:hypothetical protein